MKSIRVILNNMRLLCYVFVVFLLTGCGKVDLLSNLPEEEANNVMSIMQQSGISVSKKSGVEQTWTVVLNNADDILTLTTNLLISLDKAFILVIAITDILTVPKFFSSVIFLEWYR